MGGGVKEDQVAEYQERLLKDQSRAEPLEVISAIHKVNEGGEDPCPTAHPVSLEREG